MRLVIFIHGLHGGGAERVTADLANEWASKGWHVTVVSMEQSAKGEYPLHADVKRVALELAGKSNHILDAFRKNFTRIRALRSTLVSLGPDVVVSMESRANIILSIALHGLRPFSAVGVEHTYPPKSPMNLAWKVLRRYLYGRLGTIVALTTECAGWLEQHTSAKRVTVIPNAVCWPIAERPPYVSPAAICPPYRKRILAVGRLAKEKNFGVLIDAFAEVASEFPDWDLVLVGEGLERSALERRISAHGLGKRVFLTGQVGNLNDWYAQAHLFAMTSLFEGFPGALAEALASGVPAVSFDCKTGPSDIIRHGVDGFLVAPGDFAGLTASLKRVMADDDLRIRLSRRAIETRHRFSMEKIGHMWTTVFAELSSTKVSDGCRGGVNAETNISKGIRHGS